jgi:SAM-dependent methyltransferase
VLRYNKACNLEDFASAELLPVIREVYGHRVRQQPTFPAGREHRKVWEVAMAVRTLRAFGVLRDDSELLGVGAGTELTVFYLPHLVRRVVATDLYLGAGSWAPESPPNMLVAPELSSPIAFPRERLLVQHMDGRWLRFPDSSFDGIFSSGSIEHFGGLADMAAAAYEMGRVLKPGGILSLSTELLVSGPEGAQGWPGVHLFDAAALRRTIVEASGLVPVDELDLTVSPASRGTVMPLEEAIRRRHAAAEPTPQIVLTEHGQVFTSVHLALAKPHDRRAGDNSWAAPSQRLREQIQKEELDVVRSWRSEGTGDALPPAVGGGSATSTRQTGPAAGQASSDPELQPMASPAADLEQRFADWDAIRARGAGAAGRGQRLLGFIGRTTRRIRDLGVAADRHGELWRAAIAAREELDRELQQTRRELAALAARVAEHEQATARFEGDARGAFQEIWPTVQAFREPHWHELLTLKVVRVQQARLESDLADLRAFLDGPPRPGAALLIPAIPLGPRDFAEALQWIETQRGEAGAAAVELSLQDGYAEDLVLVGHRHFGARLSGAGDTYRFPNDLVVHVDFTAAWNRPSLLADVEDRLGIGGSLFLLTATHSGQPSATEGLTLVRDERLELGSGGAVRVLRWDRSPA